MQSRDFMSSLAVISRDGQQRVLDHPTESGKTRVAAMFGGLEDLFFLVGKSPTKGASRCGLRPRAECSPRQDRSIHTPTFLTGSAIGANDGEPAGTVRMAKGDRRHRRRPATPMVVIERLGRSTVPVGQGGGLCLPGRSGEWIGVVDGNDVSVVKIGPDGLSDRLLLGRHEGDPPTRQGVRGRSPRAFSRDRPPGRARSDSGMSTGDRAPTIVEGPSDLRRLGSRTTGPTFLLAGPARRSRWRIIGSGRSTRLDIRLPAPT